MGRHALLELVQWVKAQQRSTSSGNDSMGAFPRKCSSSADGDPRKASVQAVEGIATRKGGKS